MHRGPSFKKRYIYYREPLLNVKMPRETEDINELSKTKQFLLLTGVDS